MTVMANVVVHWPAVALGLPVVLFDFVWLASDDEEKLMMLQMSALQTEPLSSKSPKFLLKSIWILFSINFNPTLKIQTLIVVYPWKHSNAITFSNPTKLLPTKFCDGWLLMSTCMK